MKETFWADSKTVLEYINNDARRFHIFVGNRVQEIRNKTSPEQWRYIGTKENPADVASRGSSVLELIDNRSWWNSPELLWKPDKDWNLTDVSSEIPADDPEVKRSSVLVTQVRKPWSVLERLEYFSSWHHAKKAIAVCLHLQEEFRCPNDKEVNRDSTDSRSKCRERDHQDFSESSLPQRS